MINTEVKVYTTGSNKQPYWEWCSKNATNWKAKFGFMGQTMTMTYVFNNPEDATAFKLRFGL